MRTGFRVTGGCLVSVLLLVIGLILGGCHATSWHGNEGGITIGGVFNLTGYQAGLDGPTRQGAVLAVQRLNEQGGVLDLPVGLACADGETDPEVIRKAMRQLFEDHPNLSAVTGLSDTTMVLAAAPVAAEHRTMFLTSGASSPKLPQQVPSYLYLACFGDNIQAAAAAQWTMRSLGAERAAIIYDEGRAYPRLLHGYFCQAYRYYGGHVAAIASYDVDNGKDYEPCMIPDVDVIYLATRSPGAALAQAKRLRDAGFDCPIIGGDSFDDPNIWRAAPQLKNIYYTTHVYLGPDNHDPQVQDFLKRWKANYPNEQPSGFAAMGYDAIGLIAQAMKLAGSSERGAVLRGIQQIHNYQGVTGTISYVDGQHIPTKPVTIMKVTGGQAKLAVQMTPSYVPAP